MSRILLLLDAGSLFYGVCKAFPDQRINYRKLLEKVSTWGDVVRSIAYGRFADEGHSKFVSALEHIGFETKYKQKRNARTSNNVEMFADLVRMAKKIDEVVLCSSDPDLVEALRWAREEGIRITVLSIGINRALRQVAVRAEEIKEDLLDTPDPGPTPEPDTGPGPGLDTEVPSS